MSGPSGVAKLIAQSGAVETALASADGEVTVRQQVQGWKRTGATLTAPIAFGPYAEPLTADRVLVWIAGEPPATIMFAGTLGLPAGVPFVYDLHIPVT